MKKTKKSEKGFTLVEIIVVLVILAILAAVSIPSMIGFVEDSRGKAYITEARAAYLAAQTYATEKIAGGNKTVAEVTADIKGDIAGGTLENTLKGSVTDGASITDVTIDANGKVTALSYHVKSYTVTINAGGDTTVEKDQ